MITKLIGLGSCKGPFEVKKESTQMCLCEENVLQKIPRKPSPEFQNSCRFSGLWNDFFLKAMKLYGTYMFTFFKEWCMKNYYDTKKCNISSWDSQKVKPALWLNELYIRLLRVICVLVHNVGRPLLTRRYCMSTWNWLSQKRDCSPKIYLSTYFCSWQLSQERNHHQ